MPARGRNRNIRITRSANTAANRVVKEEKVDDDEIDESISETLDTESITIKVEEPESQAVDTELSSASRRRTHSPSPYGKTLVAEYGSDDEENERTDKTRSEKLATAKKLASNDLRNFIPSGNKRKDNHASDEKRGNKFNNKEKETVDDDFDDCMSIHADDDTFLNDTGDKDTNRSSSKPPRSSMFGISNSKKRKLATPVRSQRNTSVPTSNIGGRLQRKSQPQNQHTPRATHSKSSLRPLPPRTNNRPGLLGEKPAQEQLNPTGLILQNIVSAVLSAATQQNADLQSPVSRIPSLFATPLGTNSIPPGESDIESSAKSKQITCRNWSNSGTCRFGDTCRFVHQVKDSTAIVTGNSDGAWKQPIGKLSTNRKRSQPSPPPKDVSNHSSTSFLKQFDVFVENKNIVEAWKALKQALRLTPQDVPISFVESLLVSCSTLITPETVDICMEVFEAVGAHRHKFIVQDFECLIKSFCHAEQYESALQVAIHMKSNTEFPMSSDLLDLFLYKMNDSVIRFLNFLLDNIDNLDDILRYISAKEWWDAYEMLGKVFNDLLPKCQGKFLYLLMNLEDKEPFIDLLDRIDFADVIPASVIKTIINEADSPDTVALITKLAPKLPLDVIDEIDNQIWNHLLIKCCDGRLEHLMLAQQVHGTMSSLNIPLTLQGATHLLLLLCKTKSYKLLCELVPDINFDVKDFPTELIQHISILLRSFDPKESPHQHNHMMALLKMEAPVPETVLANVIRNMMGNKEFGAVVDLLKQCKGSSKPSFALLSSILKVLEYNCPEVQLSVDVYAIMRLTYPNSVPTLVDASTDTDDFTPLSEPPKIKSTDSTFRNVNQVHIPAPQHKEPERLPHNYVIPYIPPPKVKDIEKPSAYSSPSPFIGLCRYIAAGRTCHFGLNCRFSHIIPQKAPEPLPSMAQAQPIAYPISRVTPQHDNHASLPTLANNKQITYPSQVSLHRDSQPSLPNPALAQPTAYPSRVTPQRNSLSNRHTSEHNSRDGSPVSVHSSFGEKMALPSPIPRSQPVVSEDPIERANDLNGFVTLIKRCGYDRPLEDLARIHIQMRKKDMQMINLGVCKAYVVALSHLQKSADNFDSYLSSLNKALSKMTPGHHNPSELPVESSLDSKDLLFIGHVGILLMQHCNQQKKYHDGYRILHILHAHEVNYCELGREYPRSVQLISHCEIAVIAITICINVTPAQLIGALEVLRGANYALPIDGHILSASERADRHTVVLKLVSMLIQQKHYDEAYEVLDKANNKAGEVPGCLSDFKSYYDELIVRFSTTDSIEKAIEIFQFLQKNSLTIESQPLKALINGLAASGRTAYSRQLFYTACDKGFYQPTYNEREPLSINIVGQHTKTELLFVIECHLDLLRKHHMYGENSFHTSSWQANRASNVTLRIVFNASQLTMQQDLLELLTSDLNPPLTISSVDQQRIDVEMMSIKRWYLAVPPFTPSSASKPSNTNSANTSTVPANDVFNGSSDFRGGSSSSTIAPLPTSSDHRLSTPSQSSSQANNFSGGSSSANTPQSQRVQTAIEPIKLAIADRVTFYVKMSRVEPEATNQVINMLTRYFIRREQEFNPDLLSGPMVIDRANIFVDNFFKKHKTFRHDSNMGF